MTLNDKLETADAAQAAGVSPATRTDTIFDLLERQKPGIAKALPRHLDADRFARIVVTQLRRVPKLQACDSASLLGAVMGLAAVGLEPDGRNAHLIPYGRECTAIIDYRGYIELARRSGQVSDLYAEVVREGDQFDYELGLHRDLVHKRAPSGDRGALTHAYAVVNFTGGGFAFVVLDADEIKARRARSKSATGKSSPWQTDDAAMWRKSAIRALAPFLPYSPELAEADRVENADDIDGNELLDLPSVEVDPDNDPAAGDDETTDAELVDDDPEGDK